VRDGTPGRCAARLDIDVIQPYGCTNADRPGRLRPHVRRPGRPDEARHRSPRNWRRRGHPRAGRALPDELRGRPEARRDPRAGGADHQGSDRAPQGRPSQPRGAADRAPPARPVRGALAKPDRPDGRPARRGCARGAEGDRSMTVTAVRKDPERLTLTLEAEFEATPERVW